MREQGDPLRHQFRSCRCVASPGSTARKPSRPWHPPVVMVCPVAPVAVVVFIVPTGPAAAAVLAFVKALLVAVPLNVSFPVTVPLPGIILSLSLPAMVWARSAAVS